jgi:hypothetical protein
LAPPKEEDWLTVCHEAVDGELALIALGGSFGLRKVAPRSTNLIFSTVVNTWLPNFLQGVNFKTIQASTSVISASIELSRIFFADLCACVSGISRFFLYEIGPLFRKWQQNPDWDPVKTSQKEQNLPKSPNHRFQTHAI